MKERADSFSADDNDLKAAGKVRRASASVSAAMLWSKDSRDTADCRDGDETRADAPADDAMDPAVRRSADEKVGESPPIERDWSWAENHPHAVLAAIAEAKSNPTQGAEPPMRRGAPALSAAGKPAEPGDRSCKDAAALTADGFARTAEARRLFAGCARSPLPSPSEREMTRAQPWVLPESALPRADEHAPALVMAPEADRESTASSSPEPATLERAELEGSQSDARLDDDHDEWLERDRPLGDFGLDDLPSSLQPSAPPSAASVAADRSLGEAFGPAGLPPSEPIFHPPGPAVSQLLCDSFNAHLARAVQEQSKREEKDKSAAAGIPPSGSAGPASFMPGTRVVFSALGSPAPADALRGSSGSKPASRGSADADPAADAGDATPPLQFESRFECGNLWRAERHLKVDAPPKPRTSSGKRAAGANGGERGGGGRPGTSAAAGGGADGGLDEYDLILSADPNPKQHAFWFFFRVSGPGLSAKRRYRFNIVNNHKPASQYTSSMRCLLWSRRDYRMNGTGWRRAGEAITYFPNVCMRTTSARPKRQRCYTASFEMSFPYPGDTCFLAYHFPYRYSDLQRDLAALGVGPTRPTPAPALPDAPCPERARGHGEPHDAFAAGHEVPPRPPPPSGPEPEGPTSMVCAHPFCYRETLCHTLAGVPCDLLTITDFASLAAEGGGDDGAASRRKYVVLSARVHPGETGASWMMRGVLRFLLGHSAAAASLRRRYIFKVVPMLNPDGVIHGHCRTNLAGLDLNRQWNHKRTPIVLAPTICAMRSMIAQLVSEREVSLFVDMHGHSSRKDCFTYGCDPPQPHDPASEGGFGLAPSQTAAERIFPFLLCQRAPDLFNWRACEFDFMSSERESTGRVVVWRLGVRAAYTLEATYSGFTHGKHAGMHVSTGHLERLGAHVCASLLEFDEAAVRSRISLAIARGLAPSDFTDPAVSPPPLS